MGGLQQRLGLSVKAVSFSIINGKYRDDLKQALMDTINAELTAKPPGEEAVESRRDSPGRRVHLGGYIIASGAPPLFDAPAFNAAE